MKVKPSNANTVRTKTFRRSNECWIIVFAKMVTFVDRTRQKNQKDRYISRLLFWGQKKVRDYLHSALHRDVEQQSIRPKNVAPPYVTFPHD